jgi:hypothetical protein
MTAPIAAPTQVSTHQHSRKERSVIVVLVLLLVYGAIAYLLVPYEYSRYLKRHPGLADVPNITTTGDGHPGDPINVALVGDERQVKTVLLAAKYYPADPLTLKSCLEIADATVLKRPYDDAPVSNLFYYGRKQDLAFEFPVGDNPRERHHVRFWKAPQPDADGRTLWMGQTSFDRSVGLSHTTGQITHHIAPDVDAERDFLFDHLQATNDLQSREAIADFHVIRSGKNGGGDPWYTDGRLFLGVIKPDLP